MNASRQHRRPCGFFARLALLAVLLLAQGLLLAHEVDHLGTPDSGLCAVCQVGHGLDSPAVAAPASPPAAADETTAFVIPERSQADGFRPAHRARAPPALSLPAVR